MKDGFDLGLRRTRIQMMGQITDRNLFIFSIGQNNFNAQTNLNGNRKLPLFSTTRWVNTG
jgi:hypothetical protein